MAKNHKWIPEQEYEYGTKPHKCKNCGIHKKWIGGNFQTWEYYWNTNNGKNSFSETVIGYKETYNRPECGSVNVL